MPPLPEPWSPPARRRLFLMRHGEVDYFTADGRPVPHRDVPLSPVGVEQARHAAAALAAVRFDVALCSGLPRTRQTAEIALRGQPVEDEPRLREIEPGRISDWAAGGPSAVLGALSGLTEQHQFLAGETFASLLSRLDAALRELFARPWQSALVVAHSVVNRVILGSALGVGLHALDRIEQDACCLNLIEYDGERPLVRLMNHTPWTPVKDGLTHSTLEGLYLQSLRGR